MAEEDVYLLFTSTWTGIVEACLSPLPPPQVHRGLQLIKVVPLDMRTTFQHRFRSAVYKQFHQHATGITPAVNSTGAGVSVQLTYYGDLNTIIDEKSRTNFRDLFAMYLKQASYVYKNTGDSAKQHEAEELVTVIDRQRPLGHIDI